MIIQSPHVPAYFERLRKPIDLMQFVENEANNSATFTRSYRERAELLGVAACLASPQFVQDRVYSMGELEVEDKLFDDDTLYISLMKGSQPFSSSFYKAMSEKGLEIVRRSSFRDEDNRLIIPERSFHPLTSEINASRYGDSQNGGTLRIKQKLPDDERTLGRRLILCDDVVDEGLTLQLLAEYFNGNRRLGFLQLRKEGAAKSIGVRALISKNIADLSMFDPDDVVIGFIGPNVWLAESGMDGEKIRKNGKRQKEIYRWNSGISIPLIQDVKYKDNVEITMDKLNEIGLAVAKMDDIKFINTSKTPKSYARQFFGRFIDLAKAA